MKIKFKDQTIEDVLDSLGFRYSPETVDLMILISQDDLTSKKFKEMYGDLDGDEWSRPFNEATLEELGPKVCERLFEKIVAAGLK